ncbi:MAG: hypothetical protein JWO09_1512 [Bacteroidetes bacterium]|nr:hypothetical protein [Bacteroidota bacterium]
MSNLSIGLAYKAVFTYLKHYWQQHQDEDDLGGLLNAMDPFLWKDGSPADKTVVKDFIDIVKGISISKDEVELNEGFGIMINYLEKQLDWLRLETIIDRLKIIYSEQSPEEWAYWTTNWLQTTDRD